MAQRIRHELEKQELIQFIGMTFTSAESLNRWGHDGSSSFILVGLSTLQIIFRVVC